MCLTEGNPGLGPPLDGVYFVLFHFAVKSEGPSGGVGNNGGFIRVHIHLTSSMVVGKEVLEFTYIVTPTFKTQKKHNMLHFRFDLLSLIVFSMVYQMLQ